MVAGASNQEGNDFDQLRSSSAAHLIGGSE